MAKHHKTYIFCYDDHRGFSEDIKKRFTDAARYSVKSFQTGEDFIADFEAESKNKSCKVAILSVHDNAEQLEKVDKLTVEIKKIDLLTGLILVGTADKMEEIRKTMKFNIDAYIPRNSNSILRIHNIVKKLISEHNIRNFRKKRNLSIYLLLAFLAMSGLLILVSYFRLPHYF
jgi:DNA-binding NarL/FixJ family response regulator